MTAWIILAEDHHRDLAALDQAHQATAWLHQPGGGGEDR